MDADLVLEGGGVKGIGLVGSICTLTRRGYHFHRIAGTSAGAIVGALVAAGMGAGDLESVMRSLDYRKFRDESVLAHFGHAGKALNVLFEKGIYKDDMCRDPLRLEHG
jgi:NTE family protein